MTIEKAAIKLEAWERTLTSLPFEVGDEFVMATRSLKAWDKVVQEIEQLKQSERVTANKVIYITCLSVIEKYVKGVQNNDTRRTEEGSCQSRL